MTLWVFVCPIWFFMVLESWCSNSSELSSTFAVENPGERFGVSILHGNSMTFYNQQQLREDLFRHIFDYWSVLGNLSKVW